MSALTLVTEPHSIPFSGEAELSVIIPVFNESESIIECHSRVCLVLESLNEASEIIYVNDGSTDDSWGQLFELSSPVKHVTITTINLSRNFGKEAAMSAGLVEAKGDAVILLDADLQDPPELIPEMLTEWRKGYDVVDMKRKSRDGESWFKIFTASLFYKVINNLSDLPIPENVGDFRLLDRKVVDQINQLPEKTRFMKGLFAWPGFRRTTLEFNRDPRIAGETKWNYTKLIHLAFEGITSFSTKPLRVATMAGLFTSACAIAMMLFVLFKTVLFGEMVAGYPTLITVILLLGGVQLLSIGLMGEYVGRLFIEAKGRPLYLIMDKNNKTMSDNVTEVEQKLG
ncbi:glycosyltransferase family 2 protein [Aliivibrio sp. EL58]|uniref:glycosyltransferase family 2 protein n=1 Tax=Aliivibrio sp. EL58 TaxID=2107582 RepID=UPI000EFD02E1|nr:glycosyltransferase family 2 protein [Aliivibrio sp. EL58]